MTEETKKPKLTLQPRKLSLNKNVSADHLKKSLGTSSSTVTIDIKKNQIVGNRKLSVSSSSAESSNLSDAELNKRLSILRNAEALSAKKQKEELLKNQVVGNFGEEKSKHDPALSFNTVDATEESASKAMEETSFGEGAEVVPLLKKGFAPSPSTGDSAEEDKKVGYKKKDEESVESKPKTLEKNKKLNKAAILHMLDTDESGVIKTRSLASIKRAREKERRKHEQKPQDRIYREVTLPESITVGDLANRMSERAADVIRELMKLGIIANTTQSIDSDTAELIIGTFGHSVKRVYENQVEDIFETEKDNPALLQPRAPVVTVMGHVDHGKTSLLDALKSTDIAAKESGGITQHIGAYRVSLASGSSITFIDTPGHEAFTEMRSRGAKATDIVVLVVAGDDGVKAQTVEAISHAKAAEVPIIVAVNKMDKPNSDSMKVKTELLAHGLVSEDFGGDVMFIEVSAIKKTNLDKLEEAILLVAEMAEFKANPNADASGIVVESRLDKGKGPVTTLLVQRGTLKFSDIVACGTSYGRVRNMYDHLGRKVGSAGPSVPVEIIGLDQSPGAGEKFAVVKTEKHARDIAEYRENKKRESEKSFASKMSLEDLFAEASGSSKVKELPIIIKADVHGSVEAITSSIAKLSALTDEVRIKILHSASGAISQSDVSLAAATNAIVLGFNVRMNSNASAMEESAKVDVRYYSIIYNLLDDIKKIMSGMLRPVIREIYIGSVDIRQVFNITKSGKIAGSYVTKGKIKRGAGMRLLRDNIVIHEGRLKTLKRFKDDVKEVSENFECGIAFENYENIQVGDKVEVFELIEEKKTL